MTKFDKVGDNQYYQKVLIYSILLCQTYSTLVSFNYFEKYRWYHNEVLILNELALFFLYFVNEMSTFKISTSKKLFRSAFDVLKIVFTT